MEYAWAYRKTVLEPADLTACRVIFGEADQFPGLTVDRFHDILVTQTLSVGMEKLKPVLFPLLAEVLLADGDLLLAIEKFVRDEHIDVIALSTYRRNILARMFNPSIARKMLFHTDTPLLVMHA